MFNDLSEVIIVETCLYEWKAMFLAYMKDNMISMMSMEYIYYKVAMVFVEVGRL